MIRLLKTDSVPLRALLLSLLLFGCGGGGGPKGNLAGVVTDVDGRSVVGATVSIGSNSTTSLSNGTFTLSNISDGFQTVRATIDIHGHRWSGESAVDLVGGEENRSLNIMVSDERFHGSIGGTVIGPGGFGLDGAKIFVGGPLGSTLALADRNGNYQVDRLTPGVTYTVSASLAGYINQTKSITVQSGQVALASFALSAGTSQGTIPAPANVTAQAWTVADTVSRADKRTKNVYDWLQALYRKKRGLKNGPQARHIDYKYASRATPFGSVVEVDLFWDYPRDTNNQPYPDFFGYAIKRTNNTAALPGAQPLAVLRDPLASTFFDVDPALTPNVTYYYTIHSLDTIDFPQNGTIGPASNVASANPFDPLRTQSPSQGQSVAGNPTFRWTAVNGAAGYQVYVWAEFPALLYDPNNPSEPDAVAPVWPADLNNPGSSFVVGEANTSVNYQGPVLQRGHTYYWMVVAVDATNPSNISALSASQISKFVAQ